MPIYLHSCTNFMLNVWCTEVCVCVCKHAAQAYILDEYIHDSGRYVDTLHMALTGIFYIPHA